MTTHQTYASKIAVSDDGSRTLKRTKKLRVNEKSGQNQAFQSFLATRASIIALLFVVGLNLQLHFKVQTHLKLRNINLKAKWFFWDEFLGTLFQRALLQRTLLYLFSYLHILEAKYHRSKRNWTSKFIRNPHRSWSKLIIQ